MKQAVKPALLLLTTGLLSAIPPLLVVRDRWLGEPLVSSLLKRWWCEIDFLCRVKLPPYFLIVFACSLLLLVVIWLSRKGPEVTLPSLSSGLGGVPCERPSPAQARAGQVVLAISGIALGLALLHTADSRRLPGWDLAAALVIYLMGWAVREIPVRKVVDAWREKQDVILAAALAHLALVAFLANWHSGNKPLWLFAVLLAVAALNLHRYRSRLGPIFWLTSLVLILYTIDIDTWWFSIVGDEYSFFNYAREIANQQSLSAIGLRLFNGQAVYGTHPYLSSLIQAVFFKSLGSGSFGWRFSNIYLTAISIGLFYLFFKAFLPERVALLATVFLALSEYLMAFGKIGYNNLQALFAAALVLWAASWAWRSMRPLAFVVLGLGLGFCFYVYPAALYVVPLPLLLLLLYAPPLSRASLRLWALMVLSALFFIFPLFLQPAYWEAKKAGTFFYTPELTRSLATLLTHFGTNLLYSFWSFLYVPAESHYVAASYVDPLSAGLLLIGLPYLLKSVRKSRFAFFVLCSFAILLLLVGASHDTPFPRTTRMFLLLPWFALSAAVGLTWMLHQVRRAFGSGIPVAVFAGLAIVEMVGFNLYQAYPLSKQRMEQYQNLETLYLRTAMRAQRIEGTAPIQFVFVTDPQWGVNGFKDNLQPAYSVPASLDQIIGVTVTGPTLPPSSHTLLADPRSLVIIEPWLNAEWKRGIETELRQLGKVYCDVKTPKGLVRFQLWHSGGMESLCR